MSIYCPICEKELIVTHRERYESLDEHVSDPNGTPSLKDGYECSDENCFSRFLKVSWTEDGSEYIDVPSDMTLAHAYELLKERCKDGMYEAIGSWQRGYEMMSRKKKKKSIELNLFWFLIHVEPQYRQVFPNEPLNMAQEIGMEKKDPHAWVFTGRKWKWFKKTNAGTYQSFIPIWTIVKMKMKDFNLHYHKALEKNPESIKALMKIYKDSAYWSEYQREPRYWFRVANRILRFLYKDRFEIIENLSK